ncbi:hypothetical protein FA95DRAFT_1481726 [Auriscalpium vulgare]|uniref:Uncharacterized protein n=1 Tax=Auriscalpium vulgare TaxID=40419 RepID=A0ACB8SA87_9AGAM|nr:hypothetical protein FA95DRAFT_1481726 [Auriscalpium vulgare]
MVDNDASAARHRRASIGSLLHHYERPGRAPPSSRINPLLSQQEHGGISLWDVWRLGSFIAGKATELATDVAVHHFWGPRKKTWDLRMTMLSSIMRDVGSHSKLVNLRTVRFMLSLGGVLPPSPDALVTPVTFCVRRRRLRGILAEFDSLEDGTRKLEGEWVVSTRLWRRLQKEWRASHAPLSAGAPPPRNAQKERVILYLHGGAYYLFSPATHRCITIPLSKYTGARIFAVDYRLAPETRFPGPLHDAVSTYFRFIDDLQIPPENILLAGDSAGGGLCLAVLMYLRDNQYPLPGGAILMSPWVDLTLSCESWTSNAPFDIVPRPRSGDHLDPIACYLGEHLKRDLTHPYVSPLFGDFTGLPPLLIQGGDSEVLRDEIMLLAHKAKTAGVVVVHEMYTDAIHVFQALAFLDSTHQALTSCHDFVWNKIRHVQGHGPRPLGSAAEDELEHEMDNEKTRIVAGDGLEKMPTLSDVESPDMSAAEDNDCTEHTTTHDQLVDEECAHVGYEKDDLRPPRYWHFALASSSGSPSSFTDDLDSSTDSDSECSSPPSRAPIERISACVSASTSHLRRKSLPVHPRPRGRHIHAHQHGSRSASPPPSLRHNTTEPRRTLALRASASQPDMGALVAQWKHTGPASTYTSNSW